MNIAAISDGGKNMTDLLIKNAEIVIEKDVAASRHFCTQPRKVGRMSSWDSHVRPAMSFSR